MNRWTSSRSFRFAISVVLFLTSICFASRLANAQTVDGVFHGTVTDSTGAVLPGTTVEVKNIGTNLVRQAITTDVGFYTITQLPPGI
jgi:type 1 fimbria pilin